MLHPSVLAEKLLESIASREAVVGVIGLGYVGLPLAMAIVRAGFRVQGFETDDAKADRLNAGQSHIAAVPASGLQAAIAAGKFAATTRKEQLGTCDIIVICVPTPLTKQREPDLSFIRQAAGDIAAHLRRGTLVVLESTTYPGTTREIMTPILASRGLVAGEEFFVGYSPEREDPGNATFHTASIPKIVSGDGLHARAATEAFYAAVVDKVVPVSSTATAEAVKITENVFRAVNIALVNELKVIYDAMGIDVWDVIDAAKTKPFGYQAFYPGPGLGGHCIPIDPFYLTWKAREFDVNTRFIELAGQINTAMPYYVVSRLEEALSTYQSKPLRGARILLLGLAYKKNISDMRESPSLKLIELLERRGAEVQYHDPYIPEIMADKEHPGLSGRRSVALSEESIRGFDIAILSTDHDNIDYQLVADTAPLVVDTRNRFAKLNHCAARIVKA